MFCHSYRRKEVPKKNIRLDDVQETILETVNLVADTVTETMGPGGRNVMTTTPSGAPQITKDGVTVANSIELEDEEKNLICKIVKEAANRTNKEAGDGTTTSIALTRALFAEGHKYVKAGHNVTQIKREIDKGRRKVLASLKDFTKVIDSKDKEVMYKKLLDIATISMNGETEIAELVAKAIADAGKYGIVNVTENDKDENILEKETGIKLNQGWVSPFFNTDRSGKRIVLEDCRVLITSHKLQNASQLKDIEEALKPLIKDASPLLIISSECSNEFLSNLVANNKQGRLINCAIRPPYFGNIRKEFFTDLGIITGGTVVEAEQGHSLDRVKFEHLGFAKRVEITDTTTTIIGGAGDQVKIEERIDGLGAEMDEVGFKDLNKVEERLAKLAGGVVLIKLAKQANIEMEERRHRIEDAVNACKAALEDGIVPGGGAALVKASQCLDDEILGERILKISCTAPMRKIAENAGFSGEVAVYMVSKETDDHETINALTRQKVDAFEEGIIDPVKVTRYALANAVSVAGILLTTNVLISDIPVDLPPNPYGVY
jgi:chaperonin GroEL